MDYQENREWSDRFIPAIKQIVGPYLLETSSFEVDVKQATDLVILNARDMKIAARIRRPGYIDKYPFDFTIRSSVPSGAKTELEKIVNGFGDWMFYGHSCSNHERIIRWLLIDLSAFRAALIRRICRIGVEKPNNDGTKFVAFDVRNLPENVVIASSHKIVREEAA